jgi:hypothetical protein
VTAVFRTLGILAFAGYAFLAFTSGNTYRAMFPVYLLAGFATLASLFWSAEVLQAVSRVRQEILASREAEARQHLKALQEAEMGFGPDEILAADADAITPAPGRIDDPSVSDPPAVAVDDVKPGSNEKKDA